MPTQIAPTPVVRGEAAKIIYEEMRQKPTPEAKRGAKILIAKYSKLVEEGDTHGECV